MATDTRRSGVVPLIVSNSTGRHGRRRALETLTLKGWSEEEIESFLAKLDANGFRVNRSGKRLVIPTRDMAAVQNLVELHRMSGEELGGYDDRWWYSLVDAAWEIHRTETDMDLSVVENYEQALKKFLSVPKPDRWNTGAFARVLGMGEAVLALIRSGRLHRARNCAGRLVEEARLIG